MALGVWDLRNALKKVDSLGRPNYLQISVVIDPDRPKSSSNWPRESARTPYFKFVNFNNINNIHTLSLSYHMIHMIHIMNYTCSCNVVCDSTFGLLPSPQSQRQINKLNKLICNGRFISDETWCTWFPPQL